MNHIRTHILVCTGGGCIASGALEVSDALRKNIAKFGLENEVRVVETGCLGSVCCRAGCGDTSGWRFLSEYKAGRRRGYC